MLIIKFLFSFSWSQYVSTEKKKFNSYFYSLNESCLEQLIGWILFEIKEQDFKENEKHWKKTEEKKKS